MSDELILTRLMETQPADLELRLAGAMRGIGHRINAKPETVRALAAADTLQEGYVIASEEQAVEVADLVAQVIDGEKFLAGAVKDALSIPKRMETALRDTVRAAQDRLAKARQTGNEARVAWQSELRRRAVQEEEKRRQAAQEAAQRAAEQAALTGDDAPPPVEVAPIEVPRTVAGGTGKMGIQVRIEPGEVVDWSAVPKEWLQLQPAVARIEFLAACAAKRTQRPAPGESVVWRGVRFEARESAVNRR